jgi:hypothetical protein
MSKGNGSLNFQNRNTPQFATSAANGVSVSNGVVTLGADIPGTDAELSSTRVIPMNTNQIIFTDDGGNKVLLIFDGGIQAYDSTGALMVLFPGFLSLNGPSSATINLFDDGTSQSVSHHIEAGVFRIRRTNLADVFTINAANGNVGITTPELKINGITGFSGTVANPSSITVVRGIVTNVVP